MRGSQRSHGYAWFLATVVSSKAFAEFFVITVTFVALVAHTFTVFGVFTLALSLAALAVVSFNAFTIFFVIAVTLAALIANALAVLGVLALFPIPLLDFRDAGDQRSGQPAAPRARTLAQTRVRVPTGQRQNRNIL